MKKTLWLVLTAALLLTACQSGRVDVTVLDGNTVCQLAAATRTPEELLTNCKIVIGPADRILYLGTSVALDASLPAESRYTLAVRRAVTLTLVTPQGMQPLETSAQSVGQALSEAGYSIYAADRLDPPAGAPITEGMTVTYQPAQPITVTADGVQVQARSSAANVGQALAEAGLPLTGLDYSIPSESAPLPADGQVRLVRVVESVALTQKSIAYSTRTEPSADLELDQQELLQSGEPGLAIARMRTRLEDGLQVAQQTESESIVRPAQDRIMGYGTKIVIRTTVVDGVTIEYYRALRLMTTSYSPCQSGTADGSCSYGTSSGLPVQRGTVAMVYSWYLAFGYDKLYIPGYGYATVGDVGGGYPPGNHYWVDLAWTDEEYQPMMGWVTVYFLTPIPTNLVYVLP